jgi:hypothetical protein
MPLNPTSCADCERKTLAGFRRGPYCRACCAGEHEEDDTCDQCPFIEAGYEGQLVLKLYRLATSVHTDSKTKIKTTQIESDRVMLAFDICGITEKEQAFSYLALAVAVTNGEA